MPVGPALKPKAIQGIEQHTTHAWRDYTEGPTVKQGDATVTRQIVNRRKVSYNAGMFWGSGIRFGSLPILCAILCAVMCVPATAEVVVEIPVLAGIHANNRGVFEVMLVWWDQQPEPQPIALQWQYGGVLLKATHLGAMATAFCYALERTPAIRHTGTVSVQGVAYAPASSDGPSAGAAMAVGFIALFKGERLQRGVAMTGTIESDGTVGPVGMIPDKVRAAVREGYRTVLIPAGQLHDPRWSLGELALELNVTLKEVRTIDDAYELMTGQRL